MFLFFRCDAQDMLVLTSGDVRNVKVMEVTTNFIRYRVTDSSDSSFYRISTDSVYSIKYKNGSKDFFSGRNTNTTGAEAPRLANMSEMKKLGKEDAKIYYHGCGGCEAGVILGTTYGYIVGGLVTAIACASTPPGANNLSYPDFTFMKNQDYSNAYKAEAFKLKKKRTWTTFAIGAGTEVAVVAIVVEIILHSSLGHGNGSFNLFNGVI